MWNSFIQLPRSLCLCNWWMEYRRSARTVCTMRKQRERLLPIGSSLVYSFIFCWIVWNAADFSISWCLKKTTWSWQEKDASSYKSFFRVIHTNIIATAKIARNTISEQGMVFFDSPRGTNVLHDIHNIQLRSCLGLIRAVTSLTSFQWTNLVTMSNWGSRVTFKSNLESALESWDTASTAEERSAFFQRINRDHSEHHFSRQYQQQPTCQLCP